MRITHLLTAVVILALSLPGFTKSVKGNGDASTKQHTISFNIREIQISGSGKLIVTQSSEPNLSVTVDSNLHDFIEVKEKKDRLIVRPDNTGFRGLRNKVDLVYKLSVPDLSLIDLSGAIDAQADNLNVSTLTIDLSGASEVELSGVAEQLILKVSGAAEIEASKLKAVEVSLKASGAADIEVWAIENLNVDVSGASDVKYKGRPRMVIDTSGASSVSSME